MDDEQKTIMPADDNSDSTSSSEEPNLSEVEGEEAQPEKTEKSASDQEMEDKKVSGAEKRIHKLVDERDREKERADSLAQRLADLTSGGTVSPEVQQPTFSESQGGERELTIDDLRTIARIEVEKERTINRINREADQVIRDNPILDPDSDTFDPDVSEAVTSAVFLEIQADPSKSVKDLTKKYMKPYAKAAENAVSKEKATIAQQANETALRPNSVKPTDQKFHEKTIQEMEAELGLVY